MKKDYRFKLLSYLKEHYPDKANISHLLKEYLSETKSPRPYFMNMLDRLKTDGFVLFGTEVIDSIVVAQAQVYNDSHIMICLTHRGLDEVTRIKKQEYDLKNAGRVYKTYFSTRFMAVAGFLIALLLFFLKVVEVLKWLPTKNK